MKSQAPEQIMTDMLALIGEQASIHTFAEQRGIVSNSLDLDRSNVVLLPPDIHLTVTADLVLSEWTKEVRVLFDEAGLEASLYDDGREKRQLILKSADIVLPTLLFLTTSAFSVGLGVLSNWIYDYWVGRKSKPLPSVKLEYLEVDEQHGIKRWYKVEGPADVVSQALADEISRQETVRVEQKTKKGTKRKR